MRFELRTGLRGAGKTLGVVEELLERAKKPDPARPCYALNFDDLRPDLATPITFEQLVDWKSFPPGSTIYVDEAQRFVPVRPSGQPPAWIRDFSESRHLAIDFVWITQKPEMLDKHVRGLIDHHVHTVRKWNTEMVKRFEWGECQDRPTSKSAVRSADSNTWHTYSKDAMKCYTSAVMHTVEKRVPGFVKQAALVALALPVLIYMAYRHVKGHDHAEQQPGQVAASSLPVLGSKGAKDAKLLTPDQWVQRQIPRVAGIPWSAPIFDDQKVQAHPDLYCVEVQLDRGGVRCFCQTEQGTRATVPFLMCRQFAEGGVYNPYRAPLPSTPVATPAPPTRSSELASSSHGVARQVAGSDDVSPRVPPPMKYVPPSTGPWNPTAL